MTVLVDWEIQAWIDAGKIGVTPFDPGFINPNSLDLRLGDSFVRYHPGQAIDPMDKRSITRSIEPFQSEHVYISPEDFILGTTLETISLPSCVVGAVEGKSSLARLGLELHQTGGWIDAGFNGQITLEIKNNNLSPILLRAGMRIGQIVFFQTRDVKSPYSGKYNGQSGATTSRYYENR